MPWARLWALLHGVKQCFFLSKESRISRERHAHRVVPEIVQLLRDEDWTALRAHFTLVLRWLLKESVLKNAFDLVKVGTGPIVSVSEPVISIGWFITTVRLPVQFKRAQLVLSMPMTASGKLLGLQCSPQHMFGLGNQWQTSRYADDTKFEARTITLSASGYKVSGVATVPATSDSHPCVILLSGSGPCNADSSIGAAKPFKDLSIGLACRGIATIRFDKVTFANGKRVRRNKAFTLTDEYVPHALAAVDYCLEHLPGKAIYLLGHSLGAYVAPKIAIMDKRIAGCILLACPSGPMYRSAIRQLEYFANMDDLSDEHPLPQIEDLRRQAAVADSPDLTKSTPTSSLPLGIGATYWLDMRNYSPVEDCKYLQKPILCLQGGRDYQVTSKDDYQCFVDNLESKANFQHKLYDELNHLMIAGTGTPGPLEYETPDNVDEAVIEDIGKWINACSASTT